MIYRTKINCDKITKCTSICKVDPSRDDGWQKRVQLHSCLFCEFTSFILYNIVFVLFRFPVLFWFVFVGILKKWSRKTPLIFKPAFRLCVPFTQVDQLTGLLSRAFFSQPGFCTNNTISRQLWSICSHQNANNNQSQIAFDESKKW